MKKSIFLFFAAILCATSAWGANVGFEGYDCGIKYTQNNGSATEWNFSGQAEQSKTLEGNTTSLLMNEWFACMYQDADNTIYGQDYHKFQYKIHRTAESAGTNGFKTVNANWWSWENWDYGYRHPKGGNNWANINLLEGIGSGNYTMTFYFQHNGDKTYESKVNTLKWTTNVPDVSSISCSSNGAGTGTEADPFLVPVGKTLTLSVSGTQKYNDPNSTLYAKFGTGTYSSTVTHDLMPTSTKQSITISVKYYNNTDDLTGGEKTITVYYQTLAEETNDVTIVCKCGGVEIQPSGEPISVGVSTVSAIPAPTIPNYIFTSWEVGDGINAVDVSANPISITTKASGDYTLTANYERSLYYYLTGNDAVFGMEGESTWHPDGVKMTWDEASKKYSHTVSLVTNKYYKFRVTDGTWEGKWGYSKLNPAIDELLAAEDDNILFALSKAGELTIAFDGTSIELTTTGEFAAPVYTIVGVETLTGYDWSVDASENDMTQSPSDKTIYTLTKTVTLPAGEYPYKAVRNRSWDWSVPNGSDNETLTIEEAGTGTITYTLDVDAYTLTAEVTDWIAGSVAQEVNLVGIDDTKAFTEIDQKTTSVSVELGANQVYAFNITVNGNYMYNSGAMWRGNCTDWTFESAGIGQEAHIITDIAGTYTFTWTYEGNKLSVTYPDGTNVPAPVFLGGGMNEWNWIATRLIPSADGKTASVTVNLTAESTTEFKIKEGDTHLGNDGTMTREYHEGFIFSEKKQDSEEAQVNAKIYADATGEYTFTWTYETNALTVDYPEIVTEPVYGVVEDEITNFVFDTEAWPMVCMGGPSTGYQIEVYLTLTEAADGTLAYEDCSVSIMGTDATFIDGTLSNIDPFAPYADAVLRVQMGEEYYELHLAMSSTPAEPITIEVEDATVTLTEYSTNFEATEFAYELAMVANWVNEAESLPYTVEFVIPTFDPTKASGEYLANFWVTGEGDAFGMNENVSVTVTKDGNNVTLTGNVSALNSNAYNVTISGTLPTEPATITLTTGNNDDVIEANIGKTVNVVIERSFTANDGFYTLCVPFNMPASVIGKAYSLGTITKHVTDESIDIELEETYELSAGVPYLVLPKANMSELVVENVTIQSDPASGQNITKSELNVQIFFEGFYSASGQTDGSTQYYVGEHGYLYNEVVDKRGLSGLFTITDANGAPFEVRARVVTREDEATGFENITNGENTTIKLIENGQLIIIRGGEKFNAQGQKL